MDVIRIDNDQEIDPLLESEHNPSGKQISSDEDKDDYLEFGALEKWTFQTLKWIYHPNSHVHDSAFMFSVAAEVFVLMLVVGWGLTWIYNKETIKKNPILEITGYNNVCVGLDMPPALYVSASLYAFVAYFQTSYVLETFRRIRLERSQYGNSFHQQWKYYFVTIIHIFFLFSSSSFSLCFVIHPWVSIRGHTRPFEAYMISRCLVNISIYVEDSIHTKKKSTYYAPMWMVQVYILFLCVASFGLPLLWESSISFHEAHPASPPLYPWELICFLDYSWIFLIGFQNYFLPDRPVVIGTKFVSHKTLEIVSETFSKPDRAQHRVSVMERRAAVAKGGWKRLFRRMSDITVRDRDLSDQEKAVLEDIKRTFVKEAAVKDLGLATGGLTIALLYCELSVDERAQQLLPIFQRGLFSNPATYHGVVRINVTANGVARMSVRIVIPKNQTIDGRDAEAEADLAPLPENQLSAQDEDFVYIDFLLAEFFKEFFFRDLDQLQAMQQMAHGKCPLHSLPTVARGLYNLWTVFPSFKNSVGICGKEYYGGLPHRLGDFGACKWGLRPRQTDPLLPREMTGGKAMNSIYLGGREKEAVEKYKLHLQDYFSSHRDAQWDFVVQVASSRSCEIESGVAHWDEKSSPYQAVGTLRIPAQALDASHPLHRFQDRLQFNPWNTLAAHRPLGSLQRARRSIYEAHGSTRREVNNIIPHPSNGFICANVQG